MAVAPGMQSDGWCGHVIAQTNHGILCDDVWWRETWTCRRLLESASALQVML